MKGNRDNLKNDLLSILEAGRELSPSNDEELADSFLSRLESSPLARRPRHGLTLQRDAFLYALLAVLGVLVVLPIVMIVQTYSSRDGYLPPLDAGAMPAIYWLGLAMTVILLAGKMVGQWTGWQVRILLNHSPR